MGTPVRMAELSDPLLSVSRRPRRRSRRGRDRRPESAIGAARRRHRRQRENRARGTSHLTGCLAESGDQRRVRETKGDSPDASFARELRLDAAYAARAVAGLSLLLNEARPAGRTRTDRTLNIGLLGGQGGAENAWAELLVRG